MTATYKTICEWLDPNNLPRKDLSRHSKEKLEKALKILLDKSFLTNDCFTATEAASAWLLITELLNRGFGPMWASKHIRDLYMQDQEMFDLYWLSLNFPKHQTLSDRWNKCFDPELSESERVREIRRIAGLSSYSRYKKLRIINLAKRQKVCCNYYCDKAIREYRERVDRGKDKAASRIRAKSATTKAEQSIGAKLRWWVCARLVGKDRPTDMAVVYTAMTGKEVSRQAASKAVKSLRQMGLLTK